MERKKNRDQVRRFRPIRQKRISSEVLGQLKQAILSGLYRPGEKMPAERELTEQFQVSRVVIREAIRELEITGFVRIQQGPSGGAYITDLSFDHVNDAFLDLFLANKLSVGELVQARLHLEPEIARLAALNADRTSLARLAEALKAERKKTASHAERVYDRLRVHYLLAAMSGNRLYQAIDGSLLKLTAEIVLAVKPAETVIHDPEEHADLVQTVGDADPEAASRAMKKHLENIGESLVRLENVYRERKGLINMEPRIVR